MTIPPVLATSPTVPSLTNTPTTVSVQSSPEGPRGRNFPVSSPSPLNLPESPLSLPGTPKDSFTHDAPLASKGGGLIRRISRGAVNANKLVRRRQSCKDVASRDQSYGPSVVRHRSGSKSTTGDDATFPELDPDEVLEDIYDDREPLCGLGLSNDGTISQGITPRAEGGINSIIPSALFKGTVLTKVTKKKRKDLKFVLDMNSARVSWNPTNTSKRFCVDDITSIHLQDAASNYRKECLVADIDERLWFTVIYTDKTRSKGKQDRAIHLLAPSPEIFDLWTSALQDLKKYRHDLMKGMVGSTQDESMLRDHWKRHLVSTFGELPPSNFVEHLDLNSIESLCRSLHLNCSRNMLRAQFERADLYSHGYLNFQEFKEFVKNLKERNDHRAIFKNLTKDNPKGLDLPAFLRFLRDMQRVDVDADRVKWEKRFCKYARGHEHKSEVSPGLSATEPQFNNNPEFMNDTGFSSFLSSVSMNAVSENFVPAKLDRPLNEYFVASSHNTYLFGRQLAGISSTEAYVRALQRACRCVEIDCWDGPDGQPRVLHGRTMTSSVLFTDCISVIAKYAFKESKYPLIISLEVHCNAVQQQIMVDIMKREFGEWLVTKPLNSQSECLPSPEELRNRILIKVKAGTSGEPSNLRASRRQRSVSSPAIQGTPPVPPPSSPVLSSPPSLNSLSPETPPSCLELPLVPRKPASVSSGSDESDPGLASPKFQPTKMKRAKSKIINSLGDLGVYAQGLKFDGLSSFEDKPYNHIFSLVEGEFEGLCKSVEGKAAIDAHNRSFLMRVYPSGFRMRSSNFHPLTCWKRGVQMAALNWQTYDLGMQINNAMFASGVDRTGYVLKPEEMRGDLPDSKRSLDSISSTQGLVRKQLVGLTVDMISAQQVPRPRNTSLEDDVDPYIEIEIISAEEKGKGVAFGDGGTDVSESKGVSGIGASHKRRTQVIQSNGYNPEFKELFKLSVVTRYPSLVFIRWTVWNSPGRGAVNDRNAVPLGVFTAKLSSLQQGYRHLPLFDHNGDQFIFSSLFCCITKDEPLNTVGEDVAVEKMGRLKQIGSVFKRTKSADRRAFKEEQPPS